MFSCVSLLGTLGCDKFLFLLAASFRTLLKISPTFFQNVNNILHPLSNENLSIDFTRKDLEIQCTCTIIDGVDVLHV